MATNSVTPMRLVPADDFAGNAANVQTLGRNDTTASQEQQSLPNFPVLTSSQISINKPNNVGDLTNLDKELLEVIHTNDLKPDAKARLYWTALHKAEIYKDKSAWTEPVIVELRENRFIPIPILKSGNTTKQSSKRKNNIQTPTAAPPQPSPSILEQNEVSLDESTNPVVEESNNTLKRMALVNRIQNGSFKSSQPLVVYGQQDQHPPSTQGLKSTKFPQPQLVFRPVWFQTFIKTIETEPNNIKSSITNLIEKIIAKDPQFEITKKSFNTAGIPLIETDPKNFLKQLVRGTQKSTSRSKTFLDYLDNLGVTIDQLGGGLKRKSITKWVKL
jgi:hypothetical protein